MKKLLIIAIIFSASTAVSQWVRCGGNHLRGEITSFASNKQGFYAASGFGYYFYNIKGGLNRTNDNGFHWKDITPPVKDSSISALATIGDFLFAAAYGEGLFRSSDGGDHWTNVTTGISNTLITSLYVFGNELFLGTEGAGVFKSIDSGKTWKLSNNGITKDSIGTFVAIGDFLYVSTYGGGQFSGHSSDIYRSSDHGQSWVSIHHWNAGGLGTLTTVGFTIFALFDNLYESVDSGATWVSVDALNQQFNVAEYARNLATHKGDLFVVVSSGHEAGVHVSRDTGKTWSGSLGPSDSKALGALNDTLVMGSAEGLWFSVDHGYHWFSNPNVGLMAVTSLIQFNGSLFAAAGNVYRSYDQGETWVAADSGITGNSIQSFCIKGDELFAGGNGIWKLVHNNLTWIRCDSTLTGVGEIVSIGNDLIGIDYTASLTSGVVRSTDDGVSWAANSQVPPNSGMTALGTDGTNVFIGANNQGLWRSTDQGASWQESDATLPSAYVVSAIGALPQYVFAGGGETGGDPVWRSSDHGTTWTSSSNNFSGKSNIFKTLGNSLLAAGEGIFLSRNNGNDWMEIDQGLPINGPSLPTIFGFSYDDKNLYAGTYSGIYRRPFSDFGISDVKEYNYSLNIFLSPNPTIGTLTIRDPAENLGGISIVNVLGEKIMEITAQHSGEFTIDLSKVPAGMYYARIQAAGSVEVLKIIKE